MNRAIHFKFGTDIEHGPSGPSYIRTIKRLLIGRGLGHMTKFLKYGTPL